MTAAVPQSGQAQGATPRILCVDDDPSILAGFQRTLRRLGEVNIAPTGGDALQMVQAYGPYAVVVADMHMPGMDGITVLTRIRELSPDTVRLMLTGAHDQHTAMQAVNQGCVFRFLAKPCQPDDLMGAVSAALHQYQITTMERDLLQQTLAGSIRVLIDILEAVDHHSFGFARTQRDGIRQLCVRLGVTDTWAVEVGAMLANLGSVTIPPAILVKARRGDDLLPAEREMLDLVPENGARLLMSIPRLESVAAIVRYHRTPWDGGGAAGHAPVGAAIPMGARIVHVLMDFSRLTDDGLPPRAALGVLRDRAGRYDPAVMSALAELLPAEAPSRRGVHQVAVQQLHPGMVLLADVETTNGQKLVLAGQPVTQILIDRLRNFARVTTIREPLTIETLA